MAKVYPSLFAYLLDREVGEGTSLDATQRPVVVCPDGIGGSGVGLRHVAGETYELLAPHVKGPEFAQHGLASRVSLPGGRNVDIHDVWLDLEQEDLESEQIELDGERLENRVPEALRYIALGMGRLRANPSVFALRPLLYATKALFEEAQEPLIISMEREVHRTFRDLRTRLTRHLKREPRMQKLNRVQEMDAYCLRHLIHQPGRTVAEKAGQRQEIMGVYRQESHDSWENRFVKAFALMLISEGQRYVAARSRRYLTEVRRFLYSLSTLVTDPSFAQVQTMAASSVRLNNVLLRRPDYNKVFRAYRAYLARKRQTERLWPFRVQVLADWAYLHVAAALVSFKGALVQPALPAPAEYADLGRFLPLDATVSIRVAVLDAAYTVTLQRGPELSNGDLCLDVTREDIDAPLGAPQAKTRWQFPVWAMWGAPSADTTEHARAFLDREACRGVVVYWTDDEGATLESHGPLSLLPMPYPRREFEPGEAMENARTFATHLVETLIGGLLDAATPCVR